MPGCEAFADTLRALGHGSVRRTRARAERHRPLLSMDRVDGMVSPFTLEVLANPDLCLRAALLAAHESHLAGCADEAEASYVGWITCVRRVPAQAAAGCSCCGRCVQRFPPPGRGPRHGAERGTARGHGGRGGAAPRQPQLRHDQLGRTTSA
jgi:hypothetical protein